ncbi:sensor histidine kinase [Aequorivita capsosiphonis]|uniref:sensor histidine kinase n=1 Tax=Aequorivita capsosiphonis TaxID=487317 RepID=UPI00041B0005|nr:histidine kinase [Aequorivita capsosiphonis]
MKTNKFHITLCLLSMIWNFSFSQNYINYTEKDGLASNFVYRMTQDNEGFIWFLTDKGISKFDGKTFKNFTTKEGLPTNDNWHIRIAPDNRVWYFSRSDALGYINNDSVFKFKASDGKMMNPIWQILQSGNDISFVSGSNRYQFSDTIWQSSNVTKQRIKLLNRDVYIVSDTTIRDVQLEDKQGRLLLLLKKNRVYRNYYQFSDSLLVKAHDSYFEIINLNSFKATYGDISHLEKNEAPYHVIWFNLANDKLQLSGGKWLITFDDKLNIKQTYSIPSQLNATNIFQDKDGFIWAATSTNGVYKLPIGYSSISTYFEDKKMSKITEIDSVVYVGVDEEGIYKLENNKPKLWVKQNRHLYNISLINETICYNFRLHLILENREGFKRIESSTTTFTYGKNLLHYNNIYFMEGNSSIWRLNNNFEFENGYSQHPYYQGLFNQNDSLFSFSFKKMLFYNTEKDIFQEYKEEQIQQKFLTNTLYNAQNYIGTEGDGLYKFSEGKLHKLIRDDTAVINQISVENSNSIWTVSEGVLLHYKGNNAGAFSRERYNQINGLPTNNLTEVLFYKNRLYLGSTTGLNIIDKTVIKRASNFTPYVKSVYLNETKMGRNSVAYLYKKNVNLKVNFGAVNFFDPINTTFEYRLSPTQANWTTTASGEVNLYNLQPEDYTLELKVNYNGINKIKSIPLAVIPNWWQTPTFKWGTVFLTLILVSFATWVISKNLRKKREEKLIHERQIAQLELGALRSQMNPHFVHNSLNAIQYYIQRNEVELSEDYLAKFATLIRLFFEYSRRRTISIKEEVLLLENYLDVEKLRFEEKLEYKIIIDKKIDSDEQLLPSMILQPIVENAVNHGLFHKETNGNIEIRFTYNNPSSFTVTIKDDGIGILKSKKIYKESSKNYQSRSTNVLQERLKLLKQSKEWNVSCTTEDRSQIEDSSGTLVTLTFNQQYIL